MTDLRTLMSDFRRPAMLLRAARLGLQDFHRERDLKRFLRMDCTAGPESTLPRLLDAESQLEETRRVGDASYSLCRHIEVLIALMAALTTGASLVPVMVMVTVWVSVLLAAPLESVAMTV